MFLPFFFSKGNDFCDILFASLEESTVLKGKSTHNGKNLLVKEQILLGVDREGSQNENVQLLPRNVYPFSLTLLHSERPKLYTILAFLSAIGLNIGIEVPE